MKTTTLLVLLTMKKMAKLLPTVIAFILMSFAGQLRATTIFSDNFDSENGGVGQLNYFGWTNWNVTNGAVDLIGNGFYDFQPGHGLYVDMDGTTDQTGTIETRVPLVLSPGTYTLSFLLAGNQRGSDDSMTVSMPGFISQTYTLHTDDQFAKESLNFTVTSTTTTSIIFQGLPPSDQYGLLLDDVELAKAEGTLTLVRAASRLIHSSVGTFDIDMPLTGESGVEDRCTDAYTAVFTFDGPVASGEVEVVSGTATVMSVTADGDELSAQLSHVANPQIVTLRVSNINGDGLQYGDIPFGFLKGDVTADRVVDRSDQQQINQHRNQIVDGSNFREDMDLSDVVDKRDLYGVTSHLGNSLP